LKLSALGSGAQEIRRLDFRLDAQLRSVIIACEPLWRAKGIIVEAELERLVVAADEDIAFVFKRFFKADRPENRRAA